MARGKAARTNPAASTPLMLSILWARRSATASRTIKTTVYWGYLELRGPTCHARSSLMMSLPRARTTANIGLQSAAVSWGVPLTWSVFSPAQPAAWRNPCWSECYHTSSVPVFAFELHSDVQHAAVVSYSFLYLRVSFRLRASSLAPSILGATSTAGRHLAPCPPIPRLSPPREKPVPNISISFAPC